MFWKNRKPSDVLFRHIEGLSGRYELDDLVTGGKVSNEKVVQPLMRINEKFRTQDYPIGLTNPESYSDIKDLADILKSQGM